MIEQMIERSVVKMFLSSLDVIREIRDDNTSLFISRTNDDVLTWFQFLQSQSFTTGQIRSLDAIGAVYVGFNAIRNCLNVISDRLRKLEEAQHIKLSKVRLVSAPVPIMSKSC